MEKDPKPEEIEGEEIEDVIDDQGVEGAEEAGEEVEEAIQYPIEVEYCPGKPNSIIDKIRFLWRIEGDLALAW